MISVFVQKEKATVSVLGGSFHFCMGFQRRPVPLFHPMTKFNILCALFFVFCFLLPCPQAFYHEWYDVESLLFNPNENQAKKKKSTVIYHGFFLFYLFKLIEMF